MDFELYQERILEHYKHPRNFRGLDDATAKARDTNPLCGDDIEMFLKVGEGETIEEITFQGRACSLTVASASMLTEKLKGLKLEDALAEDRAAAQERLGVPVRENRVSCMMLPVHVTKLALGKGEKGRIEG